MRSLGLVCLLLAACGPGGDPQNSDLSRGPKHGANSGYDSGYDTSADASHVPTGPMLSMTPGALCTHPDEYRYPEHIAYCRRDVSTGTKARIIAQYEQVFHFSVQTLGRQHFKIDHFIPLCMGGANDTSNLWPQYETIYPKTDPIEFRLCQLMEEGHMTQAKAIEMIKDVKLHLEKADAMIQELGHE